MQSLRPRQFNKWILFHHLLLRLLLQLSTHLATLKVLRESKALLPQKES
jgi:hypothetical protein